MGTPYERTYRVTTTGSNEIVTLGFPGRGILWKVVVVNESGNGSVKATGYSRAFSWPQPVGIERVVDRNGKVQVEGAGWIKLKPGDPVTVAGTAVYDGQHRVLESIDDYTVVLTADFTSRLHDTGTLNLNVTGGERQAYLAFPQLDSGELTAVTDFTHRLYVNQDPQGLHGTGYVRKIYVELAEAGDYAITLGADLELD